LGTYAVGAAAILGFYFIAALEERELRQRFGQAYSEYQAKVPQLIPTFTALVSLFRMGKA
jgi:protein-S-isoprenylcysteine O-methyltransferase Ste14